MHASSDNPMLATASGSTDSSGGECAREALEHARDALPITRWRVVVQALSLRPEQVCGSAARSWPLSCGSAGQAAAALWHTLPVTPRTLLALRQPSQLLSVGAGRAVINSKPCPLQPHAKMRQLAPSGLAILSSCAPD